MRYNFATAMKPLLAHEGHYSNHPDDPGGATMRGVTQAVYNGYLKSKKRPPQSVRNLTDDEYLEIYRKYYWDKVWGNELPPGVDYCVFDGAVNSGPGQAIKWLQRAAGVSPVDGVMGYATLAKVEKIDPVKLIDSMCDQRLAFMKSLKNWRSFSRGWTTRVRDVRKLSKQMANRIVKPEQPTTPKDKPVDIPADEGGKATPGEVKTTQTQTGKVATRTGLMGVFALVMEWLSRSSEYISTLTGLPAHFIQILFVVATSAIIIGGVVFAVIALREVVLAKLRGEEVV